MCTSHIPTDMHYNNNIEIHDKPVVVTQSEWTPPVDQCATYLIRLMIQGKTSFAINYQSLTDINRCIKIHIVHTTKQVVTN